MLDPKDDCLFTIFFFFFNRNFHSLILVLIRENNRFSFGQILLVV